MDDSRKKQVMVAVVVICIAVAAVVTLVFNNPFGGGSAGSKGPVQMLCVNPDCGYAFEISRDEFRKQMMKKDPMGPMMGPMGAPPAFTCPKCGKESAYMATKCPKCGNVFIIDYSISDDYPDRCPECGYSALEESRNKRNKAK